MIVLTAPTGLIGRQVVNHLIDDGGETVRVIARDASRIPEFIRERVEVIDGSHSDADVVDRAFEGARALFWLVPADDKAASVEAAYVDFSRPAVEAVISSGIEKVVTISAIGRGVPVNAGNVSASLAMDDLFAATGVGFRALAMPSFMDNLVWQAQPIRKTGVFFTPITPSLKMPSVATRDIAATASRLLLDRGWSGNVTVPVLGPQDLSFDDMAVIASEVLGMAVRCQQIPGAQYKAMFLARGYSEAMAQAMVDMAVAKDGGLDNSVTRTAQNSTPTTFRQWCLDTLKPAVSGA